MRQTNSISNLCILLCAFLLIAGCNDSFEPLQKNDKYFFSIFGYLDASADTQWVRVGTVRLSVNEPPDPSGIQVTLEDLQSGKSVVMNDSLFTSKNILNYWTTMDIKNEQTYRITAEGTAGKASSVTVTTPKKLPDVFIAKNRTPLEYYLYIDDSIEHIADIQSVWYVIINPKTDNQRRIYRFPLRNTIKYTGAFFGAYSATVIIADEFEKIQQNVGSTEAEISVVSRQFLVASAGPAWNDSLSSIKDVEYFLDGTGSNVENELGFVPGVDAKWFKQDACLTPDSSNYVPCEPVEPYW